MLDIAENKMDYQQSAYFQPRAESKKMIQKKRNPSSTKQNYPIIIWLVNKIQNTEIWSGLFLSLG